MRSMIVCIGFVIGVTLGSGQANAQDEKARDAQMKAAAPGPVHQQLAKLAGEYTTHSKLTFKPGAPPQESDGSAKLTLILGGRFVHEQTDGKVLERPFSSVHLLGYNNDTHKYEGVWMYTGSTAFMTMTGTSPDDGKTINYTATVDGEGEAKRTFKIVIHQIDDDHFTVTLTDATAGQGATLETAYTRKK
jgi:Protein of unknown function (DUF1579)